MRPLLADDEVGLAETVRDDLAADPGVEPPRRPATGRGAGYRLEPDDG